MSAIGETNAIFNRARIDCYTSTENSEIQHIVFLSYRGNHFRVLIPPPDISRAELLAHMKRQLPADRFLKKWAK